MAVACGYCHSVLQSTSTALQAIALCLLYLCLCPVTSVVSDSLQPRPAPLSMGFSRQEHWSGLPFPSPGDLPDPGIQPVSPASVGRFFTAEPPGNPCFIVPSPQSLGNADLLAIYIFLFFSRMSYHWNHTVCSSFRLAVSYLTTCI